MNAQIQYRQDSASLDQIVQYLREVDAGFVPVLSGRTDLVKYAEKLKQRARLCEAWADEELVGLVAGYCNDHVTRSGFITSVSVLGRCLRQGIGEQLVEQFLALARASGMTRVQLEVSKSQQPAVRLYRKLGFQRCGLQGGSEAMDIKLSGDQDG